MGLKHHQSEGVQFEERQAVEECDAAQGRPDYDCHVHSVLQLHGHVEVYLEVFDP